MRIAFGLSSAVATVLLTQSQGAAAVSLAAEIATEEVKESGMAQKVTRPAGLSQTGATANLLATPQAGQPQGPQQAQQKSTLLQTASQASAQAQTGAKAGAQANTQFMGALAGAAGAAAGGGGGGGGGGGDAGGGAAPKSGPPANVTIIDASRSLYGSSGGLASQLKDALGGAAGAQQKQAAGAQAMAQTSPQTPQAGYGYGYGNRGYPGQPAGMAQLLSQRVQQQQAQQNKGGMMNMAQTGLANRMGGRPMATPSMTPGMMYGRPYKIPQMQMVGQQRQMPGMYPRPPAMPTMQMRPMPNLAAQRRLPGKMLAQTASTEGEVDYSNLFAELHSEDDHAQY